MHGYHERNVADVPIDARRVFVAVRIRRLICPTRGCRPDPNPRYSDIDPATLAAVTIRVHRRADALIIDVWDTDPTRHHAT